MPQQTVPAIKPAIARRRIHRQHAVAHGKPGHAIAHLGHQLVRDSIEHEALLQAQNYVSEDYREMKAAKAEDRAPVYRGR